MTMKARTYLTPSAIALAAFLGLSISPDAQGVAFQNLAPDQYVFKLSNYDEGALYAPLAGGAGSTAGVTNNPAAGVAALDALPQIGATFAHNTGPIGNGLEDSWGVAFVTQIFKASDPVTPVWSAGTDNQQLTIMFYGAQDFFLRQNANGTLGPSFTTGSVGFNADFYLQDTGLGGFTSYNALALGPGARPANTGALTKAEDASFPTVTDSNGTAFTLGVPVLTTRATPGFLRGVGDLGGPATELETTFNGDALTGAGEGAAFVSVAPTLGGLGTLNGLWNNNSFLAPHIAGNTADFQLQFTATTNNSGPWLLNSQDPIRTQLIPEPTTALVGLGCMLPIFARQLGRRRKATA
jgi:hypothetical protein